MNTTRERPLAAKVALVTGGSRGIFAAPHIGYVARDLYRTFYWRCCQEYHAMVRRS
jgi:hypothetical protein